MSKKEELLSGYVESQEAHTQEQSQPTNIIEAQPIPGFGNDEVGYAKTDKAVRVEKEINKFGWHKLDVKTLPSGGLFYPDNTEIWIKSATGEEIKHWSTIDDSEYLEVNASWNYIMERCVSVKTERGGSWRDLKDIDRLYLLLAVRELTFIDDDNDLFVPISEGKNVPVTKEMVHYLDIPSDIMSNYSATEKCFVFELKTGRTIKIYVPSVGVNDWVVNYLQRKRQQQQGFDEDFLKYAPLLIPDYRNLTDETYERYVVESRNYGIKEWSLVGYVVDTLRKKLAPNFKYTKEDGSEAEVPISFLGGPKAIFTISNPLQLLR